MIKFTPTHFGLMAEYPIPEGCSAVILCVDRRQHEPVTLCLTHQVYREKLLNLLETYPDAEGITIIPFRSEDKVMVSAREIRGTL